MKKWLIGSLAAVVLMIAAAGVYAQSQDKNKNKDKEKTECKAFVDQNKDGVCDNQGTANCKHSEGCMSNKATENKEAGCSSACKAKAEGKCKEACQHEGDSTEAIPASSCHNK